MNIYEELVWRGLIKDVSSPDLIEKLNNGGVKFYLGTDPTADSLHIGHYSTFLVAKRLQKAGHTPILLVGGATGLVGDPRGTGEREKADAKVIEQNYTKLKAQVEKLFGIKTVNNLDWFKDVNYIEFLRDYGKYGEMAFDPKVRRKGNSFAALNTSKTLTETERLRLQLAKLEIENERLKKGYEVKGVGADKEFVSLSSKNSK